MLGTYFRSFRKVWREIQSHLEIEEIISGP